MPLSTIQSNQSKILDLGLADFPEAWHFQKKTFQEVKNGFYQSALILCRHYPVITLGKQADKKNILASPEQLKNKGIRIYKVERGGDVTYHGPGQLMIYPIVNLTYFKPDIHLFLRNLEEVTLRILSEFGIKAERKAGFTGVWVEGGKIASIGIAIKNWITYHGLALNIKSDDLDNFSLIRPCGLDIMMISMESVLGREIDIGKVKEILKRSWQDDQGSFAGIRRGD